MRRPARRDERGSGMVELIWLGLVLLVPLVYIVVSVFSVQRSALATTAAARAAGRAFALAETDARGRADALAAAQRAFADQGLPGQPLDLRVECGRPTCHVGGAVVTVTIATRIAMPLLPAILGGHAPGVALDASQTVPVGQYQEVTDAG